MQSIHWRDRLTKQLQEVGQCSRLDISALPGQLITYQLAICRPFIKYVHGLQLTSLTMQESVSQHA